MAIKSFRIFATQAQEATGELRVGVIKVIFDLLIIHGLDFMVGEGLGVSCLCHCYSFILGQQTDR